MNTYLLFRLYGPMASWGDIAVGEYRPSLAHPSKSAVLGLVAAALGILRIDEEAHRSLARSLGFAVRVDRHGSLLRDYHTIQRPSAKAGVRYETRQDELDVKGNLNTTLSTRDYYVDALYTVALWVLNPPPRQGLEEIKAHLDRPVFPLYLGRKSCPLSLPMCAQVITADSLKAALDEVVFPDAEFLDGLPKGEVVSYHWDESADIGMDPLHTVTRRDVPFTRRPWQFSVRKEHYRAVR